MLLIDVDNVTDVNDEDDDDTVHTPSCSSSCSTASSTFISDARISWIRRLVRELDIAFMSDTPVVGEHKSPYTLFPFSAYIHSTLRIVCSANDNSSFMLDCVHAGAADYLIKPLRPDVIKTLFLVGYTLVFCSTLQVLKGLSLFTETAPMPTWFQNARSRTTATASHSTPQPSTATTASPSQSSRKPFPILPAAVAADLSTRTSAICRARFVCWGRLAAPYQRDLHKGWSVCLGRSAHYNIRLTT